MCAREILGLVWVVEGELQDKIMVHEVDLRFWFISVEGAPF